MAATYWCKAVLRSHCDAEQRSYDEIERTNVISSLLAPDTAALAAKRECLTVPASFCGSVGTMSQVTDLVGAYRDAGVQLLISRAYRNDLETLETVPADVMPHFT
jgi:hypothetical protein